MLGYRDQRPEFVADLLRLETAHTQQVLADLRQILREYVEYYNRARCHQSLDGDTPEPRSVEGGGGSVYAIPHLGGLHHEYRRAA